MTITYGGNTPRAPLDAISRKSLGLQYRRQCHMAQAKDYLIFREAPCVQIHYRMQATR
jgi:hypothetical protein